MEMRTQKEEVAFKVFPSSTNYKKGHSAITLKNRKQGNWERESNVLLLGSLQKK
jgi:hypothetical protein